MATTATKLAPPTVDLRTPSTLPIRLGSSILESADLFSSIRFNHKPSLNTHATAATITPGETEQTTQLSLPTDDGRAYRYAGATTPLSDAYVLLPKGREMLLERLSSLHVFNLVGEPDENDEAELTKRYPQLTLDGQEEGAENLADEDLFGEDDGVEQEVDPDNPFDWRHALNKAAEQEEQAEEEPKKSERNVGRRVVLPAAPTKKRKQAPTKEKGDPKRVKAGDKIVPVKAKPQRTNKSALPEIRLDRKASIRKSTLDLDDSGELILEDEEDLQPTAKPSAMALALTGHLGDGPISLRSAASSPAASRLASASPLHAQKRGQPRDESEEIDLDPDGSAYDADDADEQTSTHARQPITTYHFDDLDGDEDDNDNDEADADVEDLELPSPAQAQRPSISAATVTAAPAVEEDDDLGARLAAALGEDDDGAPRVHESDEESEEE